VSSLSSLIDFLMGLMRDKDAHAAFEHNPQAVLAHNGLANVTGQDVRDARMIMQDGGGLKPNGHQASHHGGHDPVREIHHTTTHYQVDQHYQYVDQTFNLVSIDDRDTTVVDSFNSNDNNDTHVVAVQDNSHDTVVNVEDSFNHPPAPEPKPVEPKPEPEPDPVDDHNPVEHEPIHVEPIEDDGVVSIQPVEEDHHLTEPVDDTTDLDHHPVDAAII
jgi:hypothetical protein